MRILITGGFGYVGGRLAQIFASMGCEILLGTRKMRPVPASLPGAVVVQLNWNSLDDLCKNCQNIDVIVHAAGMNAQECQQDPAAAFEVNGVFTERLVGAAISQSVRRFIYISTIHVYGNFLSGKIDESTRTTSVHPYATSHRAGEDAVLAAHKQSRIEGIVIRLSNAFGTPAQFEGNCWNLSINGFCRQAARFRKMTLRSGSERRDFVPLSFACEAVAHLGTIPTVYLGQGIFNVGSGHAKTIWEIATIIQERSRQVLGFKPEIISVLRESREAPKFEYGCDSLIRTNFKAIVKEIEEIDSLLTFCATH